MIVETLPLLCCPPLLTLSYVLDKNSEIQYKIYRSCVIVLLIYLLLKKNIIFNLVYTTRFWTFIKQKGPSRMDNSEKHRKHWDKTNETKSQKTKRMSNTDLTITPWVNQGVPEGKALPVSYKICRITRTFQYVKGPVSGNRKNKSR